MPRARQKSTNRGSITQSVMIRATELCLDENQSVRSVAANFNICRVSLSRFIKKMKLHRDTGSDQPLFGYRAHNKVFNQYQENQLAEYIKNSTDMYFGLSPKDIRKLAFKIAIKLNLKIPTN